jgi:DNA invertase Pin-like site-specific DNA recombinase
MPLAFSYTRFSSEKQSQGDSIRRQKDLALEFIKNHPELQLELDTSLQLSDEGLSAYKGFAQTKGSLGVFLRLVEDGKIEKGSYLLVESLDRLSRQTPRQALTQLNTLVDEGIILVTLSDNKVYTKETLDADGGMSLIFAIMLMARAHEESVIKAKRVSSAWRQKMRRISEGIQLTKRVPFWINSDDRTKPIAEKVKIVKKIFELSIMGFGGQRIAKQLNEEGVPTPSSRSEKWSISSVKKVLNSEAVIGVLNTADGEKHEAYYPKVISDKTWVKTRIISSSSKRSRDTTNVHPLSGLCVCASCGGTAIRSGKTGRIRKDGTKNIWRTLVCANSLNKASSCEYRSIAYDLILQAVKDSIFASQYVEPSDEIGKELHSLEWGLTNAEDLYEDLREVTKRDKNNLIARQEFTKLGAEIDEIKKKISELNAMKRPFTARQVEGARVAILNEGKVTNANFRMVLKKVEIDFVKRNIKALSHDGKMVESEILNPKDMSDDKAL